MAFFFVNRLQNYEKSLTIGLIYRELTKKTYIPRARTLLNGKTAALSALSAPGEVVLARVLRYAETACTSNTSNTQGW
jgi:hypothetical protein